MQKTISIFTLTQEETGKTASFSTNKQAIDTKKVLECFGVNVKITKVKKVIEL